MDRKSSTFFHTILLIVSFGFIVGVVLPAFAQKSKIRSSTGIIWHNIESGLHQARNEDKPIVVDFYTSWCHWCKVMDEKTYRDRSIIRYASRKLIMVKVDAESQKRYNFNGEFLSGRELAQKFDIKSYPTTVFLDSRGQWIDYVKGYISPEQFLPILRYIGYKYYEEMTFEDWLKKSRY